MSYKEAVSEFASLPRVSELESRTRRRVTELLEQLDQIVADKDKLEAQEEDCKNELEELQNECGAPGFRYGVLCFMAQVVKGRKTINADKVQGLLLEYGYPPDQMASIWKEGAPSSRRTFRRLPEEE